MKTLIKVILLASSFSLISSCTVHKNLHLIGGSKADGTLTFAFEYGGFEKPVVQWREALNEAKRRCQSWGYSSAEFFGSGITECVSFDQYGNCVRQRVTYTCQCTN